METDVSGTSIESDDEYYDISRGSMYQKKH